MDDAAAHLTRIRAATVMLIADLEGDLAVAVGTPARRRTTNTTRRDRRLASNELASHPFSNGPSAPCSKSTKRSARIRDGTYGICEHCGETIPAEG